MVAGTAASLVLDGAGQQVFSPFNTAACSRLHCARTKLLAAFAKPASLSLLTTPGRVLFLLLPLLPVVLLLLLRRLLPPP